MSEQAQKTYFVDEAGDPVLFDAKGKVIVGQEGCSKFFIMGFLDVSDPALLDNELRHLHSDMLADPYLKKIPSMQPEQRKTAIAFHAKDDLPEVRREVFKLLVKHDLRFFAEVQDKRAKARWVQNTNRTSQVYHYTHNSLYDGIVSSLFKNHLHKNESYCVVFAKRGLSDRTKALGEALQQARIRFRKKWGIEGKGTIEVALSTPPQSPGLQAVDYFLWALQRCYERREDRYLEFVWSKVHLVHDISDCREGRTGRYYNQGSPLSAAALPSEERTIKKEGREV